MSPPIEIVDRLADQLELPAGARDSGGDSELEALLSTVEKVDTTWSAITVPAGADERVWAAVLELAEKKSKRWSALPKLKLRLSSVSWSARIATAGALATAVVLAVSLTGRGPSGSEILARAEAAIAGTSDKIVHQIYEETGTSSMPGNRLGSGTSIYRNQVEQWVYTRGGYFIHEIHRDSRGKLRSETARAPTREKYYDPTTNTVTVRKIVGPKGSSQFTAGNAFGELEKAFGRKRVKFLGETKFNGRPGYKIEVDLTGRYRAIKLTKWTYIVDRRSYLPIGMIIKAKSEARGVAISGTTVRRYSVFEGLKPSKTNRKLLELDSHPGAKTVRNPVGFNYNTQKDIE